MNAVISDDLDATPGPVVKSRHDERLVSVDCLSSGGVFVQRSSDAVREAFKSLEASYQRSAKAFAEASSRATNSQS